jgi:hypothetical protein
MLSKLTYRCKARDQRERIWLRAHVFRRAWLDVLERGWYIGPFWEVDLDYHVTPAGLFISGDTLREELCQRGCIVANNGELGHVMKTVRPTKILVSRREQVLGGTVVSVVVNRTFYLISRAT